MEAKNIARKNEVAKLKYQLNRYKTMGNGAMCQVLNSKIKHLEVQ